jgi:hypothetical protein
MLLYVITNLRIFTNEASETKLAVRSGVDDENLIIVSAFQNTGARSTG